MSKTPQKCQKRQLLSKSQGGFCNILFTAMILGSEVAQGVYNNLRKQLQSYLWSPGKYWQKRFGHFHQFWAFFTINVSNFSNHFMSQKIISRVVWSFHDTLLKWDIRMNHFNIGQHLVNTVEKVYNTSKWTCFYIQFVHPNYIFFTSDEKHELVVFLIFWDKVCLWNGCYVNISRMVLILQ